MTMQYPAVKSTTGGTTPGNTAGIKISGRKLMMMMEITGKVMFVDWKMNGLGTITEMALENQKIRVNGPLK